MTQPQQTATYNDPLMDGIRSVEMTVVGVGTAGLFAAQIVVAHRASRQEQQTRLQEQRAHGVPEELTRSPTGQLRSPAEQAAALHAARDTAASAVAQVFRDDIGLSADIQNAAEFDAFAARLVSVAEMLNLDPVRTLTYARNMIDGLRGTDVMSAAAVLHARLGWLLNPDEAPPWASERAARAAGAPRSPTPNDPNVVDGTVLHRQDDDPAAQDGAAAAAGDAMTRAEARARHAVNTAFEESSEVATAIRDSPAFSAFAQRLEATARSLGLSETEALTRARDMIRGLGGRTVQSAVHVLRARLVWLADPALAPKWAAGAVQRAHTAAKAAGAATDTSPRQEASPDSPAPPTNPSRRPRAAGDPAKPDRSRIIGDAFPNDATPTPPTTPPQPTPGTPPATPGRTPTPRPWTPPR